MQQSINILVVDMAERGVGKAMELEWRRWLERILRERERQSKRQSKRERESGWREARGESESDATLGAERGEKNNNQQLYE